MEKTNFFFEHYFYLKKMYPADEILLFRCGDFYETYMDDAEKVANVLGITLTRSSIHKEEDGSGLRIASFPYYNLEKYVPKLRYSDIHISVEDSLYY